MSLFSKCRDTKTGLTFQRVLTFRFIPTAENKSSWVHGSKVLGSLEAQPSVCTDNDDRLSCQIVPHNWCISRKLVDDEIKETDLHGQDDEWNRLQVYWLNTCFRIGPS